MLAGCGGSKEAAAPHPPAAVRPSELTGLARSLHQPVYWAGAQGAKSFGLTREGRDRILVHYPLKPGARAAMVVGTYRLNDAVGAVRRSARSSRSRLYALPHGGVAVAAGATDVHLAYPSAPFQVEVFDPAGRALPLVRSGQVRPVSSR